MARIRLCAVILVFMIGFSVFSCINVSNGFDRIVSLIESAETREDFEEILEKWESFSKKARLIIRYDKLKEADLKMHRLIYMIEIDEHGFPAEIAETVGILRHIRDSELPFFRNIF